MTPAEAARLYRSAPAAHVDVGTATIPVRTFGSGPAVLFVHGWPLNGAVWRKILPRLAERFTCHVVDLPGAGDSDWKPGNDFSFHGHAEHLKRVADHLRLTDYHLVAHDTGATVARRLAVIDQARARRLVLIDTEIPHHRPKLVPTMQKAFALPGATSTMRVLMRSRTFLRSELGFGTCVKDRDLVDAPDFRAAFIEPLLASHRRMKGQILYARGIDWDQLDGLATGHGQIRGPVLLVWGDDDPFFPLSRARQMVPQFPDARLVVIPGTRLLPHEEKPDEVADHILSHLEASCATIKAAR